MSNVASENSGGRAGGLNSKVGMGIATAVVALGAAYLLFGRGGEDIAPGTTFIAKRGNLDITVSEGGSIEALESQEIRSHIKGHSGVKILKLIDEGYLVTAEDVENGLVLVELDSADLVDRRINQEISVQSAQAQFIEKRAQFDIQMSDSQSQITAAELTAKFALMDFEKFLGKKAVDALIDDLGLVEKAAELVAMKEKGLVIEDLPEIAPASGLSPLEDFGAAQEWGRGGPGRGDTSGRGLRGSRAGGASEEGRPQRAGRRGGPGGGARGGFGAAGGGMDPESFKKMIEANGGKLPQAMEDRMREMGMDPNMILERMGMAQSGESKRPDFSQELQISATDIETKPVFTNEPAYIAARTAIDFSSYANVDELEDGEAKKMLRQLEDDFLVEEEAKKLAEEQLRGYERLAEAGHITPNELANERLAVRRQVIREELADMSRHLYIQYSFRRDSEQFLSDYEEALMSLERTIHEAGAQMAQADVGFKSAERKYGLEVHQLDDLKEQIAMCVIRAERTGLVVYGSSSDSNKGWRGGSDEPTQEGKTVRQREKIITIPDMTKMGVTVDIQESDVQKVAIGQRVTMTIDAFRDRVLVGNVERVAVLADSGNMFMNPDLKVYPTMVRIDGVHDWLRPGMTANVSVLIETLTDVVYIPIQAVSYFGDAQVCYVVNDGKSERRFIEVGSFTENFIEVRSGLEAGEEVRLLPPGAGEQDKMKLQEGVDAAEPKSSEMANIT